MYRKLPTGIQDVLPRECVVLSELKDRLSRKFLLSGYQPVLSATLEYYDTYSKIRNAVPQERMFKLTDRDGKLLVLRPDVTLSISRIAATKLQEDKIRLSYISDKWDMQTGGGISNREIYQAGVECLGEEGAFSDAQAIAFSVECLKETGLTDFIIDIGHVGYFKGILQESGLSEELSEEVRAYVNAKDTINSERLLKQAGVQKEVFDTVMALPTLFGGEEVLDRALSLTQNACAREAINHLKEVYSLLVQMGYEKYICFDLGTVKRLSYYSGIVFSGLVKGLGAPVLSGGRYDDLCDDFGKHVPAVGFAMGLKRILVALERSGKLPKEEKPVYIFAEKGAEKVAYDYFLRLTAEGQKAHLSSEYYSADCAKENAYLATKEGVKKL